MSITTRLGAAAIITVAAALGLAGTATAAPLNDPNGLCSYHDDKGNCWVAASGPSVNIEMVFPSNAPQEQAIVDYLTTVENDFGDSTEMGSLDSPRPQQELDVTTATYNSAHTQTAVLTTYQNLGGAHPLTWYKAFVYSNAAKAPVTFDTLFVPGASPLDGIAPIVAQQMSATAGQPISIDPDIAFDPANYQNFAITDDAVIFFFGQNQMHPAFGATEVSVPRSAIASMLAPNM